ncbi:MAG: restriction endonuclease [Desulfurococcaceae archaeon]
MPADPIKLLLKYRSMSLEELSRLSGYPSWRLEEILSSMGDAVKVAGGNVSLARPLDVAISLLERGASAKEVSSYLDWRDFEALAAEIMGASGYAVARGVRIHGPLSFEIDVLGVDAASRIAIAIDCKHWSRNSAGALREAARAHRERVERMARSITRVSAFLPEILRAREAVPMIVTLLTPQVRASEGVLVISISELGNVLRDLRLVLDEFELKPLRLL